MEKQENEKTMVNEEPSKEISTPKTKKLFKLSTLIISSVIALVLGILIMFLLSITGLFSPSKTVARINGENFTSNDVDKLLSNYLGNDSSMKISLLLDSVDKEILSKKYTLSDEDKADLEQYISYYTYYYGLSEDYAKEYLTVSKLRELYYLDHLSQNISEEDITNYYENDVIGDIECEHLLVMIDEENFTDKQSLKLANEIISKLNSGESFENVVNEYKSAEKYSSHITHEAFTCQSISTNADNEKFILFSDLEKPFVDGLLALENNSFSTTPVKTSYGYHIIYRKNQADKVDLDEIKDKIAKVLTENYAANEVTDTTLFSKLLIDLRKENGFKIYNSELKAAYADFCKEATASTNETSENPESTEENTVN